MPALLLPTAGAMHAPGPSAAAKPRFRGASHLGAFLVSLVAGPVLLLLDRSSRPAGIAYAFSISALFGVSALYHVPTWRPTARMWLRRLDHSAIFFLVAGTVTALSVPMGDRQRSVLLWLIWGSAAIGVVESLVWPRAPKAVSAGIYVGQGSLGAVCLVSLGRALGPLPVVLALTGGVLYAMGAATYALRRPNPWPRTFGYHEVFHALVILAASLHYAAVTQVLHHSS